ncbi:hypothetical protein BC830DRAFT_961945 [Chytriomyces sp. MP71]|nr:hypothetical protein BC830DRAFT_961945 [Chytriomyces sp. MP71]
MWAFYSDKKRLWLSITRSGELFAVVEIGKVKVKLDGSNVLDLNDEFVGDGALVYWASANAIDYYRLSDFHTQFRRPCPAKWINAGYDLARLVFGKKGEPVLSPSYEQETVCRYLWSLEQADSQHVNYDSNVKEKSRLFPGVNWKFEAQHQKKLWVDVLILFDIVMVLKGHVLSHGDSFRYSPP